MTDYYELDPQKKSGDDTYTAERPKKKSNRAVWWWIIGILLVALLGCGVTFGLAMQSFGDFNMDIDTRDGIAIVRVEGVILPGEGDPSPFSTTSGAYSTRVVNDLEKAAENERVKAIVLYVDSPGGSVFASDEIALKVQELEKPIVSAMASVAASGGYYISTPADEIWASPHTITCSIGVIAQLLNYDDLARTVGVESVVFKSGEFKDIGNPFRDVTEEESAIWQALIDEAYDAFVAVVAEGRGLDEGRVREIADGRICTGKQAEEMQLVDNMGYLPDVIKRAAELGGLDDEDPRIIEYKQDPSLFELLNSLANRPSQVQQIQEMLRFHAGSPLMYLYMGP